MWQRGCFPPKPLIPPRRLHRTRGRYEALSTLVRRAYTQRRTRIGQALFPFFEICARNHPFSSVNNCHNQTDSLPAVAMSMIVLASWLGPQGVWDGIYHSSSRIPHPRGPTPFESELVIPETIVRLDRLAGMQLLARRPFLGLIPSRATGQS